MSIFRKDLKNNPKFIKKAIKVSPLIIQSIGKKLRKDKEFLLSIINKKTCMSGIFKIVSKELLDDTEFVLECSKYGNIAYYMSHRLKDNEDVLLSILNKQNLSYCYASERLRNNASFMLKIIEREKIALEYVSDKLLCDKQFVIKVIDITKGKTTYKYEQLFLDDEDVMLKRLEYNKTALANASNRLKNDKNFILKSIKIYDKSLKYASKKIKQELNNK